MYHGGRSAWWVITVTSGIVFALCKKGLWREIEQHKSFPLEGAVSMSRGGGGQVRHGSGRDGPTFLVAAVVSPAWAESWAGQSAPAGVTDPFAIARSLGVPIVKITGNQ